MVRAVGTSRVWLLIAREDGYAVGAMAQVGRTCDLSFVLANERQAGPRLCLLLALAAIALHMVSAAAAPVGSRLRLMQARARARGDDEEGGRGLVNRPDLMDRVIVIGEPAVRRADVLADVGCASADVKEPDDPPNEVDEQVPRADIAPSMRGPQWNGDRQTGPPLMGKFPNPFGELQV
jgi:hypothetical protein